MIFLSAQPDEFYFLWQLQLQLFNFHQLKIEPDRIHVLIGYNADKGLSTPFKQFISENKQARFFCYSDRRSAKKYLHSICPHIIANHFRDHPELEEEVIFYHDSDVLLRALPNFKDLIHDDVWYVSNTSFYLDSDYIKSRAGEDIFHSMCAVIGISPDVVEVNDKDAGGAQYLIKNCPKGFWEKVEADGEAVYGLLEGHNRKNGYCGMGASVRKIQSWCAGMWAIWWNALSAGRSFRIHPELDFCWVDSPVAEFEKCNILHYTGWVDKANTRTFRKSNYVYYPPFNEHLSGLDNDQCGWLVSKTIGDYKEDLLKHRTDLSDTMFLMPVRIDSQERLENVYAITSYIYKYFQTTTLLLEVDDMPRIDTSLLNREVRYCFIEDSHPKFHRTKYHNLLMMQADVPYIALYDADVVLPVQQITEAVRLLREDYYSAVSPYDGNFVSVDRLLKAMFIKLQEPELLESNRGKLGIGVKRSYGGAIFLNRDRYIQAGMENENISSWGPDDLERVKRLEVLGYKVKRLPGSLYHLPHERGVNSSYQSIDEKCHLLGEYLSVSSMKKDELQTYIKSWKWM